MNHVRSSRWEMIHRGAAGLAPGMEAGGTILAVVAILDREGLSSLSAVLALDFSGAAFNQRLASLKHRLQGCFRILGQHTQMTHFAARPGLELSIQM